MEPNLLVVFLSVLWLITLVAFLFYLSGKSKRHRITIEKYLADYDQTFLALQKSEERYNKLIGHMNEGLIFTDEKDRICFVNKCASSILKATPEKLLNRSVFEFVLGPAEARKLGLPYKLKRHGCSHKEEIQMVRNNGEMFWASMNISYLDVSHDHMPGSIIVLQDISEQKAAEEKLHNLTINLNQRVKQMDCLFEISDITNTPGISLDTILDKTVRTIPYGLRYPEDLWVEIIVGEKRYVSKNFKETIWSYMTQIKGSKNKLGSLRVGYREDKSFEGQDVFPVNERILIKNIAEKLAHAIELKDMEHALAEGFEKLRELQDVSQVGSWEFHIPGKRWHCSSHFFDILDVEESQQKNFDTEAFFQRLHPDDLDDMKEYVRKMSSNQLTDGSHAYRIITRKAETRYIFGNVKPLFNEKHQVMKVVGTIQDITDLVGRFSPKVFG